MILLICSLLFLEEAPPKLNPHIEKIVFANIINDYKKRCDNFNNEKFYLGIKIVDIADQSSKLFKDYNKYEKDVFYLNQGEKLIKNLKLIENYFSKNLEIVLKEKPKEDKYADAKFIEISIAKIKEMKKEHYVNFKVFVDKFFKEHNIPEIEKNIYLENLEELNR